MMIQDSLHTTLEDFYKTSVFKRYNRNNYKPCLAALEVHCINTYPEYSLRELFENVICVNDIIQAAKLYFATSRKAYAAESVNRFLSAIDFFYKFHLKDMGIRCKCMEEGCRRSEIIKRIEDALGIKKQKAPYLPITQEEEKRIDLLADSLNCDKFYPYGQKIIYQLMLTYGFKTNLILDMKMDDLDLTNNTLKVQSGDYEAVILCIPTRISSMFQRYMDMQVYKDREYLFTNSRGEKLNTSAVFDSLQDKIDAAGMSNVSSTRVALYGIEKLIEKGLLISEIVRITGFSVDKIATVSEHMIEDLDVSESINKKLGD